MLRPTDIVTSSRAAHIPFEHQKEAVRAILKTFKTHDRTHVVMACGTGKTHVCLWVAEQLKAKRIVVFVPSLALIHQILHEWLINTIWKNVSCMAVCSDASVTTVADSFILKPEECDFPVSTKPVEIRHFLKQKFKGVQLVFCTYHSSGVLAAALSGLHQFDLAIFDEAHKTTGVYDRNFSIPLTNKNIPAIKRLFVTATPRHYNVHTRTQDGDAKLIYSMDSEAYYGPRAYTLSFRKAVNLNIISDYKVLVPMIVREGNKLRREISGKERDENAIALKLATKKFDISKIITFHQNIESAGMFSYYLNHSNSLPNFQSYHVNCNMSISRRTEVMNKFKSNRKTLISNARCLTEGTNVPAVDMVAFFHKKRSKIDIVQAIGRVMRKHDNKNIGYVFLPLFVHPLKGESIESAIHREHYEHIWEVLQALSEQDEDLHQTIHNLRIDKGKDIALDSSKLSQFLVLLPEDKINVQLERELRQAIEISIIEKIGSTWDEMYGRLCAYKETYGHTNVPKRYKKDNVLSIWVITQRARKQQLSKEKIQFLEKIGFDWCPHETKWYQNYQDLIDFKKKFGHTNVSKVQDKKLGSWIALQRIQKKKLSKEKIKLLENAGFDWVPNETLWHQNYQKLILFKKKLGYINVPQIYKEDKTLGIWITTQRSQKKKLSKDKFALLENIGFNWNPIEKQWNQNYQKLIAFKKNYGNTNVPRGYRQDKALAHWVSHQRNKKNNLSKEKLKLLENIEFDWFPHDTLWQENYQKLILFQKEHGHTNVPRGYEDKTLSSWVKTQRERIQKLSKERIKLLENIQFDWGHVKKKSKK